MRAVVQRVLSASVAVDALVVGQIDAGLLVLVGVTHSDNERSAATLADKIAGLRILRDGRNDDSAATDVHAPVLLVSQFTLYGDTRGVDGPAGSWRPVARLQSHSSTRSSSGYEVMVSRSKPVDSAQ